MIHTSKYHNTGALFLLWLNKWLLWQKGNYLLFFSLETYIQAKKHLGAFIFKSVQYWGKHAKIENKHLKSSWLTKCVTIIEFTSAYCNSSCKSKKKKRWAQVVISFSPSVIMWKIRYRLQIYSRFKPVVSSSVLVGHYPTVCSQY